LLRLAFILAPSGEMPRRSPSSLYVSQICSDILASCSVLFDRERSFGQNAFITSKKKGDRNRLLFCTG
jgi:hypothetical protein